MIESDKLVHHECTQQRTAEEFSGVESKCQVQEEAVPARETAVSAIPPVKEEIAEVIEHAADPGADRRGRRCQKRNETARTETLELLISPARRNDTAREEILELLKL